MFTLSDTRSRKPTSRLGVPVTHQEKYFGRPKVELKGLTSRGLPRHVSLRHEKAGQRYDAYEKYKKRRNLANRIKKDRTRRKREKSATALAKWYKASARNRKSKIDEILSKKVPTMPRKKVGSYLHKTKRRSSRGGRRRSRTKRTMRTKRRARK